MEFLSAERFHELIVKQQYNPLNAFYSVPHNLNSKQKPNQFPNGKKSCPTSGWPGFHNKTHPIDNQN